MEAVFRADASVRIGTGHVMRCLSLARELREAGASVRFASRPHEGHLSAHVEREGYPVLLLPPSPSAADAGPSGPHDGWLGTDWRTDAIQTAAALRDAGSRPDWLIVDHYALDARWEEALRPSAVRILAIDDLADRPHACDALLDHNLYPDQETRYDGLVPEGCRRLLGPSFALLRREFAAARLALPPRDGRVRRLLIFFGGADPTDETSKALDAIDSLGRTDLAVDVVAGGANPHLEALRARCAGRPGTVFHAPAADMAGLMAGADLALGAGGTSTWERACLSLPALCVTIAENQLLLARTAHERGLIRYVGRHDAIGPAHLARALSACLEAPDEVARMAARAGAFVDGGGAPRVAAYLAAAERGAGDELSLRAAGPGDLALYHAWANDPEVRVHAFSRAEIPFQDHEKWFSSRLSDPAAALYVMERGGLPAGQIRFEASGERAAIDFSLARDARRQGLAKRLLEMGVAAYRSRPGAAPICEGVVKASNPASVKAFAAAGFSGPESRNVKGEPCLIFRTPAR